MEQKNLIPNPRLQGAMAVAAFSSGVIIAAVCLFWIEPKGEIANSAISIVSELLVLCGAILGYDIKFRKFQKELDRKADKPGISPNDQ